MDFAELNDRMNEALSSALEWMREYFGSLAQEELYGWVGVGLGIVLLIVGLILL